MLQMNERILPFGEKKMRRTSPTLKAEANKFSTSMGNLPQIPCKNLFW
jgi:hypothetical protein